jgi:hypothetical protein
MDVADITCSLSGKIFLDPVIAPNGITYERDLVVNTAEIGTYKSNITLKTLIDKLCDKNPEYAKLRYGPQYNILNVNHFDMLLSPLILSYGEVIGYLRSLDVFDSKYFDDKQTSGQIFRKIFSDNEMTSVLIDKIDVPGNILHYVCVHSKNTELFIKLLSKCSDSDVNRVSPKYEKNPLQLICELNKLTFCSLLLSRNITFNSIDKVPLNYAINHLNIDMVELLLKYDTNIYTYQNLSVFHEENISEAAMDILKMLISHNVKVDNLMGYAKDLRVIKLLVDTQINRNINHQIALCTIHDPLTKKGFLDCCNKAILNYSPYSVL